jgi:tetratricopeptide (TPR) repeat protein
MDKTSLMFISPINFVLLMQQERNFQPINCLKYVFSRDCFSLNLYRPNYCLMCQFFICLFIQCLAFSTFAQNTLFASYQVVHQQSEAAAQNNDYQTAISTTEQFIKQHPQYSLAYLEQSVYAIQHRDPTVLKRNIIALKRQQISIPLDLLLTGAQLAEKKRAYQLGLEILEQATPAQAYAESLLLHKATLYRKLNNQATALTTLQQAYNNYPESPKVIQTLAAAYQDVNRLRSIQLYESLIKKEGYKDLSLTALGLLYTRLYESDPSVNNRSNLVKAKNYYQQYQERHPNNLKVKDLIAQLELLLELE